MLKGEPPTGAAGGSSVLAIEASTFYAALANSVRASEEDRTKISRKGHHTRTNAFPVNFSRRCSQTGGRPRLWAP